MQDLSGSTDSSGLFSRSNSFEEIDIPQPLKTVEDVAKEPLKADRAHGETPNKRTVTLERSSSSESIDSAIRPRIGGKDSGNEELRRPVGESHRVSQEAADDAKQSFQRAFGSVSIHDPGLAKVIDDGGLTTARYGIPSSPASKPLPPPSPELKPLPPPSPASKPLPPPSPKLLKKDQAKSPSASPTFRAQSSRVLDSEMGIHQTTLFGKAVLAWEQVLKAGSPGKRITGMVKCCKSTEQTVVELCKSMTSKSHGMYVDITGDEVADVNADEKLKDMILAKKTFLGARGLPDLTDFLLRTRSVNQNVVYTLSAMSVLFDELSKVPDQKHAIALGSPKMRDLLVQISQDILKKAQTKPGSKESKSAIMDFAKQIKNLIMIRLKWLKGVSSEDLDKTISSMKESMEELDVKNKALNEEWGKYDKDQIREDLNELYLDKPISHEDFLSFNKSLPEDLMPLFLDFGNTTWNEVLKEIKKLTQEIEQARSKVEESVFSKDEVLQEKRGQVENLSKNILDKMTEVSRVEDQYRKESFKKNPQLQSILQEREKLYKEHEELKKQKGELDRQIEARKQSLKEGPELKEIFEGEGFKTKVDNMKERLKGINKLKEEFQSKFFEPAMTEEIKAGKISRTGILEKFKVKKEFDLKLELQNLETALSHLAADKKLVQYLEKHDFKEIEAKLEAAIENPGKFLKEVRKESLEKIPKGKITARSALKTLFKSIPREMYPFFALKEVVTKMLKPPEK